MKTDNQPQHTRVEWTLEECSNGGAIVCMGDPAKWNTQRVQIVPIENAQQIVKAVNMHDELVELAKEMATAIFEGTAQYCDRKNNSFATIELSKKTFQLLKQSEGK